MKTLAISIQQELKNDLLLRGVDIYETDIQTSDEIVDWLIDDFYEVLIVDLDRSKLGTFFPRIIRKSRLKYPIIGISLTGERDSFSERRAEFLEQGGDDLLRSPCNPRELVASMRAATRRYLGSIVDIFRYTENLKGTEYTLVVNLARSLVSINEEVLYLTAQEMKILITLVENVTRVVSKEIILERMYVNSVDQAEMKIVDVQICKIRKKLNKVFPGSGNLIQTIWGRGYTIGNKEST